MHAITHDFIIRATTAQAKVVTPEELKLPHMRAHKMLVTMGGNVILYGDEAGIKKGHAHKLDKSAAEAEGLDIRYIYVMDTFEAFTYKAQNCQTDPDRDAKLLKKAFGPLFVGLKGKGYDYHCANAPAAESEIKMVTFWKGRPVELMSVLGLEKFGDITLDRVGQSIKVAGTSSETKKPVVSTLNTNMDATSLKHSTQRISDQEKPVSFIAANGGKVAVLLDNDNDTTALLVKEPNEFKFQLVLPETVVKGIFIDEQGNILCQAADKTFMLKPDGQGTNVYQQTAVQQKEASINLSGITTDVDGMKLATAVDKSGQVWTFESYDSAAN